MKHFLIIFLMPCVAFSMEQEDHAILQRKKSQSHNDRGDGIKALIMIRPQDNQGETHSITFQFKAQNDGEVVYGGKKLCVLSFLQTEKIIGQLNQAIDSSFVQTCPDADESEEESYDSQEDVFESEESDLQDGSSVNEALFNIAALAGCLGMMGLSLYLGAASFK